MKGLTMFDYRRTQSGSHKTNANQGRVTPARPRSQVANPLEAINTHPGISKSQVKDNPFNVRGGY